MFLIDELNSYHIQCTAAMNACENAKSKGADVVKQWDASLDNKTRKSHMKVDGEIRELDEPFSNGLMFPGDPSGKAKEVINCRCALLQRARWALSEDELNTLKERAEYYGLDKNKNFEKYKEKYLKAVENDGKSSTIKADKVISGHSSTPKKAKANSIIDHVKDDGTVDARGFYGNDGMKQKDIHTTNHGNPKQHDYGKHGEHGHDYEWDENGSLKNKTTRELSEHERKENGDIL
ncbi:MAG: phage minor head protein [Agathobacter sp.]|nr:phage minor head protein [Agathobacter sp.]